MADHALSFGIAATDYDRHRPRYPDEAVIWTAGNPAPARVADVGAGTGILSRALLSAGYDVLPVEPDPGMRAQLAAATPGAPASAGSAESIPAPDGTLDAVVAGQAYHWFDPDRAHAEAARVLRAGGTFGVMWNFRDETLPWVAELSVIGDHERDGRNEHPPPTSFGDLFHPLERAEFRHAVTYTPDSLVAMMTTRSYYLTATARRQHEIVRDLRGLVTHHPDLAGRQSFVLPYRTECFRARRR